MNGTGEVEYTPKSNCDVEFWSRSFWLIVISGISPVEVASILIKPIVELILHSITKKLERKYEELQKYC